MGQEMRINAKKIKTQNEINEFNRNLFLCVITTGVDRIWMFYA